MVSSGGFKKSLQLIVKNVSLRCHRYRELAAQSILTMFIASYSIDYWRERLCTDRKHHCRYAASHHLPFEERQSSPGACQCSSQAHPFLPSEWILQHFRYLSAGFATTISKYQYVPFVFLEELAEELAFASSFILYNTGGSFMKLKLHVLVQWRVFVSCSKYLTVKC